MKHFPLSPAVRSGQLLVMLSIFLCLFASPASSWAEGKPPLPQYSIATGFTVEVTPMIYDPSGSNTCASCCYPITCRRSMYQVRLFINHSGSTVYNGGDFELLYEELSITIKAYLEEGNLTRINKAETESCRASFLTGGGVTYTADEMTNGATLLLSEATLGVSETLPVIEFNDYYSEVLFTLVVDYFPGETTGVVAPLDEDDFTYIYDTIIDEGAGISYNTGSSLSKYAAPSATNSGFTLLLDDPICGEEYVIFPVLLHRPVGTSTVEYLDFSVKFVSYDPFAGPPTIENTLSGTSPTSSGISFAGGEGYVLHVEYLNASLSGNVTLFEIKVPTPSLISAGYYIAGTLTEGRLDLSGSGCEVPSLDDPEQICSSTPIDACDIPNYELKIAAGTNMTNPCSLKVFISLLGLPATFEEAYFKIDFDMPSTVTLVDAYLANPPACPIDNSCSGGNCVFMTGNSVELCIDSEDGIALGDYDDPFMVVEFYAPTGCINNAIVRRAEIRRDGDSQLCVPGVTFPIGFPFCPLQAQGNIATETHCYVEDVTVGIVPNWTMNESCKFELETTCAPYDQCVCSTEMEGRMYEITPFKDDNPLSGVTTYDLALISKHILGIELLGSPYKIIAADANKSNTITPFDMVELRKLILGVYEFGLPNNTSWRFVDKAFVFPDPANPFQTAFNTSITTTVPKYGADFVAIKIGDVNNSVIPCTECDAPRPVAPEPFALSIPDAAVKAGEYITIPVMAADEADLIAWQLGLRFDANILEFIGVSMGDLEEMSVENFGLTQATEGIIRASWVARLQDEDSHLSPQKRLFYLTFRSKDNVADLSALIRLDNALLQNQGWLFDGQEHALQLQSSHAADRSVRNSHELVVSSRPNPAGNEAWLDFSLPAAGPVRLSVYNNFGVRMLFREVNLPAGAHTLALPEIGTWTPGIYRYDLRAGKARAQGHLVKQ